MARKTRTMYWVSIISPRKGNMAIIHTFKKFDRSITKISPAVTQKTFTNEHGMQSIAYIHNYLVYTKPRADFPKVWYGLINNSNLINRMEIKLVDNLKNHDYY